MAEKKVIYIMTFTKLWADVAQKMKEEFGWEPVLYVGLRPDGQPTNETVFDDVAFYDPNSARRATWPDFLNQKNIASVDGKILLALSKWESVTYELMTRYLSNKNDGCYSNRRFFYWKILRIWITIFKQFKPDCVISGSMPHRIFDLVVHQLCDFYGIPFIAPEGTNIPHLGYAETSVFNHGGLFSNDDGKDEIKRELISARTNKFLEKTRMPYSVGKPTTFSLTGLFSESRKTDNLSYKKRILNYIPQLFLVPAKMTALIIKGRLSAKSETTYRFRKFETGDGDSPCPDNLLNLLVEEVKTLRRVSIAKRWYKRRIVEYDRSKPFIYFAANFMPERSTVPDSGYFHDFHLVMDILDKAVPADWNIYYKEHPRTFTKPIDLDNPRDVRYYTRLTRACPRLRFLDPMTDPFTLLDSCMAVAIARGTVGWEAIARGKPVLIFGSCWFDNGPGVFSVKSFKDCQKAIDQIQGGFKQDEKELYGFLNSVENICDDILFYFKDNVEVRAKMRKGQWFCKSNIEGYKEKVELFANILIKGYRRFQGNRPEFDFSKML